MTDVVWIELTKVQDNTVQSFMFGPTGVVSFKANLNGETTLFSHSEQEPILVIESADIIMAIIAKVRGTVGILSRKNKPKKGSRK